MSWVTQCTINTRSRWLFAQIIVSSWMLFCLGTSKLYHSGTFHKHSWNKMDRNGKKEKPKSEIKDIFREVTRQIVEQTVNKNSLNSPASFEILRRGLVSILLSSQMILPTLNCQFRILILKKNRNQANHPLPSLDDWVRRGGHIASQEQQKTKTIFQNPS